MRAPSCASATYSAFPRRSDHRALPPAEMPRFVTPRRSCLHTALLTIGMLLCSVARVTGAQSLMSTSQAPRAESEPGATLFRQVQLFDGEKVHASLDVLISGGKIAAVAAHIKPTMGVVIVDGRRRTLLPGLIDAHVHTWPQAARAALQFGVTTELDMFMDARVANSLREGQRAGRARERADVFSAGTLITAPGGHGTEYGPKIPTLGSADSASVFVNARVREGSDWIKIVYDDGRSSGLSLPVLSEQTLRATIAASKAHRKLSVVHIGSLHDARTAIEAGASGLAHLFTDSVGDVSFAALMKRQRAFAIPTLTVLSVMTGSDAGARLAHDPRLAPLLSRQDLMALGQSVTKRPGAPIRRYSAAESTVRVLHRSGVPLLAGTDAGNPGTAHGASLHLELELLVAAGLSPIEALRSATSVPARIFSLGDRGTVAVGKRADLLLVDGDPTREITATRAIVGVWKAGAIVDRIAYQKELAASLEAAAAPSALGDGWISRFDDGSLASEFGSGWTASGDGVMGGNSQATVNIVDGALEIAGTIGPKSPHPWAGAMFSPGTTLFAPANLSTRRVITFRARGDVGMLQLLIFTESNGRTPLVSTVALTGEWQQYSVPFAAFGQTDGRDVQALIFAGGPTSGPFRIMIDDVRLQ
ncbi:MAG: putative hydrolase [Gemmatimonadetes bacterium]|nr:putative hydrolase [Gemmatimonadota bacterium]